MTERSTSQVVGATLIGGMIGAGVALLFAPRSGKETREQLAHGLADAKQNAAGKLDKAKSALRRGSQEAGEVRDDVVEAARQTGKKAKSEMKELQTNVKNKSRRQSPVLTAWEEEV